MHTQEIHNITSSASLSLASRSSARFSMAPASNNACCAAACSVLKLDSHARAAPSRSPTSLSLIKHTHTHTPSTHTYTDRARDKRQGEHPPREKIKASVTSQPRSGLVFEQKQKIPPLCYPVSGTVTPSSHGKQLRFTSDHITSHHITSSVQIKISPTKIPLFYPITVHSPGYIPVFELS